MCLNGHFYDADKYSYCSLCKTGSNSIKKEKVLNTGAELTGLVNSIREGEELNTMERKITVKGIGHITATPDYVVINMTVDATDKKYDKAVEEATDKIAKLTKALKNAGFYDDALKTVDYRVNTATGYKKNFKGVNEIVKTGFTCLNRMKLAFDFNGEKISKAINAITNCVSDPRLNIVFTIKDEEAVKDKLLKSAGENARRGAQILCEAAGGKLGNLITVNYNWNELSILSPTRFDYNYMDHTTELGDSACMALPEAIQPDDIDLSDNAVFVWEIV